MRKIDFIQDFQSVSNCKIICKNSGTISTHKIVLAISGTFLRDLIKDIPVADEVTLLMKDFDVSEVLDILDTEGSDSVTKNEALLFPITKLEPDQIKEEMEVCYSEESDLEEEFSSLQGDNKVEARMRKSKKKERPKIPKERRGRPVLEKHAPKTAEEIEKLSENILTNPVTEDDMKNNEYWDKVVRYERALADLAMGSTLRKAADKYQLNKTNLQRFSRTGKYGMGRQGRVSTVFTFQEEKAIKEKILAYADMSGEKSLSLSLATQFFKQEMARLKVIYPERDFKNLSVTTGEAFDYMWSRRFIKRNGLQHLFFRNFTLADKRIFECDICGKSFTLKHSLVFHKKKIHFSFLND